MSDSHAPPEFATELGPCACSQIRRTARALSSLYDAVLLPSGLTVTQYALLVNVGRAGELSHTVLAAKLGMERTTLTRNMRPLVKGKLVATTSGKDRREHLLRLTEAGKRRVLRSLPLWEEAQRRFAAEIGEEVLQSLRTLLTLAESAAARAENRPARRPEARPSQVQAARSS